MAVAQVGTTTPETDLDLRIRAGVNHTDNLGRTEDGQSETFGSLGTDISFRRHSSRLDASINGSLDYFRYRSDEFSDEVFGRIDAALGVALVPRRLDWMVENRFGQVRRDPFQPDSPGNREYLNVLETGPDLYLPLGARTSVYAAGRYADIRYDRSDRFDSDMRAGLLSLRRQLSPTQRVGASLSVRRIEFDGGDLPVPGYEVQSAFLSYSRTLATGEAGIDLGANRIKRDGVSNSGLLARLNWSRELTVRSRLALEAGRDYQDSANAFRGDTLDGLRFSDTGERALTTDPLVGTFGSAVYSLGRDRAVFRLGGRYQRDRYETDLVRDRDVVRVFAGVDYRLSPATTLGLTGRVGREEFLRLDNGDVDVLELTFRVTRRLSRQWDLAMGYSYSERSADIGREFEENRFRLEVIWSPGRR